VAAEEVNPVEALLAEAYEAQARGDGTMTEALFRQACDLAGDDPEPWAALGEFLAGTDRPAEAAGALRRALEFDPTRRAWRLALAQAFSAAGNADAALTEARSMVEARPDDAAARRLLARLLLDAGAPEAALEHAREAAFLDPHALDGAIGLAACLVATGDPLAAAEALEPALRRAHPMDPERARAFTLLGRAWAGLDERGKAADALRAAIDADPEDAEPARLLAELEAGGGDGLSPAYVKALFDRYAERFDRDLTGKLRYAAPRLLRDALARVGPGTGLRVLDAGCGTGLAGVELRPLAAHLAGVDLAPRMVEQARARDLYDDLWAGDLMEAFERTAEAWDLIVAADVLVYLGDLRPVLAAAAQALRPGGRIAATVERLEVGEPFRLNPNRRYAHSEAHLRESAAAAGLALELLEPATPRWEGGKPVQGLLFVGRKA